VTDQPRFLNAAVLAHTDLAPASLLTSLKQIELQLGRNLDGPVRKPGSKPAQMGSSCAAGLGRQ
jgi:7,8-dihydro-6-hydroxymethylpterin-pyrophosphokinase